MTFNEKWVAAKEKYLNPKPFYKNRVYKEISSSEFQMIASWLLEKEFITGQDVPTSFCVRTKWKEYILRSHLGVENKKLIELNNLNNT